MGRLRLKIVLSLGAIPLLLLLAAAGWWCWMACGGEPPEPFLPPLPTEAEGAAVVFIGDTQAPLWVETLRLKADGNLEVTDRIFTAVAARHSVAALFHLGDLTALGASPRAWRSMDPQLEKLRRANIPIFPAMGNHEYMPFAGAGKENFLARFPRCDPSWYCARIGKLAVVMLNSNFSKLSEGERAEQEKWYGMTLDDLEGDPSVGMIVVGCHHSPFTNSRIVNPSEEVRAAFVPPFLAHKKCRLFVSGHAHAFEHFAQEGKDFLVTGGGGGLLHPLRTGADRLWEDRYPHQGSRGFFHYLICTPGEEGLAVRLERVGPDPAPPDPAYGFTLSWKGP